MEPEVVFALAAEAVGFTVRERRPDLAGRWQGVTPDAVGLNNDDWLEMSQRMIDRFKLNAGLTLKITDTVRRGYRKRRLVEFVLRMADDAI